MIFSADVIVVGGGHAGIEAAHAVARMGMKTILITANIDMIGQMSCNPAIGGIAKGSIAREVDAMGGVMGLAIDKAGIHFRMLNKSKGKAVWGNRAQADKSQYRIACRELLEAEKSIQLYQAMVTEILSNDNRVIGVRCETRECLYARAVIIAAGTFLNGTGHIGYTSFSCGRSGEAASKGLSESIQKLGITAKRLKTGTPARLDGRSVNYDKMKAQKGDEEPWPFSYRTKRIPQNKVHCWVTKTAPETHAIIRENLNKSALYGGKISGIGPRYCPSIEDKVVRFGDRDGHTLFLEPEGLDHHELYCNGLSNSLPLDVQIELVRSIPGLEHARIIRPAYAIEYDFFPPTQLLLTLESRIAPGLYLAGQINGTSGYEEAACQGMIAGINAVEKICGHDPFVLRRDQAYSGVLIDDLVVKGTDEPYRMFTSRAEYRLLLRQDNADERLMPIAMKRGLINKQLYEERMNLWEEKKKLEERLSKEKVEINSEKTNEKKKIGARDYLKRPEISIEMALEKIGAQCNDREIKLKAESDIKYAGFIEKQRSEIERSKKMEESPIPSAVDYDRMDGLLLESRQKLKTIKPQTLGQACRIPGVTPADISVLIKNISRITA